MLEKTLHKNLLKYAVQRAITNADGSVADVRRSVLVELSPPDGGKSTMTLVSAAAFDAMDLDGFQAEWPEGWVLEVWDGRELFGGRQGPGYRRLAAGPVAPAVDPNQGTLDLGVAE